MHQNVSTGSWSQLDQYVLQLAFENLDLRSRAGTTHCVAHVCVPWAAAAAAATTTIDVQGCCNTDSLQQWLRNRGSGVTKLKLWTTCGVLTALPCPRLECLVLNGSKVDLRPGSQLLQDLCAATALQQLWLDCVSFQGEPDLVAVVSALPALCHIHLADSQLLDGWNPEQQQQEQQQNSHARNLPAMQDFWSSTGTAFDWCRSLTDAGVRFLCSITQLQSLEVHNLEGITAAGLATLHNLPALKSLRLCGLACDISLSAVPAFSRLTSLSSLMLHWKRSVGIPLFDPAILAYTTQLEELSLSNCTPAGGAAGAAELLVRLGHMTKLQDLKLQFVQYLEQRTPSEFSSLTASSVLRRLSWEALW